ncbi:MAG: hypothetical protein FGM15_02330 [Chthoniobacterales bacterium]|nr:hypothetical protein [Chthoniobacterales bacterium]
MQPAYPRNAIRGLIIAAILLGFAGGVAITLAGAIAVTQASILVSWLPVVLIAVFLGITMVLLQRDASRRGGK